MILETIEMGGKVALGVQLDLQEAPLLVLKGEKGFLMCGYLNLEAAEELGDAAVQIRGVRSLEEMLEAPVGGITTRARQLGIVEGMKGKEALQRVL
jgi:uncharacterized protein YunC (DUF1805 family)